MVYNGWTVMFNKLGRLMWRAQDVCTWYKDDHNEYIEALRAALAAFDREDEAKRKEGAATPPSPKIHTLPASPIADR